MYPTAATRQSHSVRPVSSDYPLSKVALGNLLSFFRSASHQPSGDQLSALVDIMKTMEDMAEGVARPKFFLSSLDPGVGKTQAIRWFIDALLAEPCHAETGVLVLHGRLDEIKHFVHDAGIPAHSLCVRTSDATINALGTASPDDAQVLITTQQAMDLRFKQGQAFEKIEELQYHGRPRAVRVWDEAFLPGETITLNVATLGHLFASFSSKSESLYDAIVETFMAARQLEDGAIFTFPDIVTQHGLTLNEAITNLEDPRTAKEDRDNSAMRELLTSVFMLSGRTVSARIDGKHGTTVLDFEDTIPADLAPMLITDASGRVRSLYQDMEQDRKMIVRLRHGTKSYEPLTVKVWSTGGGKGAFQNETRNGGRLADGVARTIATKPDQRWLVVYHKPSYRVPDTKEAVLQQLKALGIPADGVSFIHWGRHMATNQFSDVPNVILAGTLFYRTSDYEALKRLGSGRKPADGKVTKAEIKSTTLGEHAQHVLQALCRGRVRKSEGARCQPMTAYIIASVRSGIPDILPRIFPGCRVKQWRPLGMELSDTLAQVYAFMADWRESSDQRYLPYSAISKPLGISKDVFKHAVLNSWEFPEMLADLGMTQGTNPRSRGAGIRFTGIKRVLASDFGFTIRN